MYANGLKNIEVTDIELSVKEKLYAVDAFKMIEQKYKNIEIFFIMGADNFINITKWKEGEKLIKRYKYIVLEREDINLYKYITKDLINNILIIKNEGYRKCSSSRFRSMLKEENIYNREIIPDKVTDYIIENKLYKI